MHTRISANVAEDVWKSWPVQNTHRECHQSSSSSVMLAATSLSSKGVKSYLCLSFLLSKMQEVAKWPQRCRRTRENCKVAEKIFLAKTMGVDRGH